MELNAPILQTQPDLLSAPPRFTAKSLEDFDLVQAAVLGDQKAYTQLMNRYYDTVFNTLAKMVVNREDAHDLTIEAFGKAFNKLPNYVPRYAFSTWLFKIAINNCIDHIRRKKVKLLSIDGQMESDNASAFSAILKANVLDPEEKFIKDQRAHLLRTVLNKLNPKYRHMIELRFYEELSYEEIAQELNIPLGTVKAQLFRAKELLHDFLQSADAQSYLEYYVKKKN